ncbi:MAG: hypothetical protein J6W45_06920, partial [Bacteroidales bacterium]|nr:hypothetical protein [Bacteroidales bacterium]
MKRALLVLVALCVAGVFSAKAQSSSDSAFVRDLSYTFINTNSLPYSTSDDISISSGGKYLKDVYTGHRAKGYAINLTSSKSLDIQLLSGNWDCMLIVLDSNYDLVVYNDDWAGNSINHNIGSRISYNFAAGQYYIIATEWGNSSSTSYDLTVDEISTGVADLSTLTYTPLTLGTPVTDTLKTTDGPIVSQEGDYFHYAYYTRAYSIQTTYPCVLSVSIDRSDRYWQLLDNNYNNLDSPILHTPGTYRIVVYSKQYYDEDTTIATPFTITATAMRLVDYNALTYKPLGAVRDTVVYDTFTANSLYIEEYRGNYFAASGYTFQGTQDKILSIRDSSDQLLYVLMDNNYNIIKLNWYFINMPLPQTGTYRLAVLDYYIDPDRKTRISIKDLQTYYVDYLNGDDARNGLTPNTALKTLDTAFARSGGVGKYYLTEDYTFSDNYITSYYAEIYPYQKDIKLNIPSSSTATAIYGIENIILGEQGGSHYFIIDSNHTAFDYSFIYGREGSHIELNNLKVKNSYFPQNFIYYSDEVVIRDCEFLNDTFDLCFIYNHSTLLNNAHLINTNFSQNYMNYYLFYNYYDDSTTTLTLENTNVVGNTFDNPQWTSDYSTVNLVSGSWRNNRLYSDYEYNSNPNLNAQNWGGLLLWLTKVNIGSGFSMDVNNYLVVADTFSTINIAQNISSNFVAQIYLMRYDYDDEIYYDDYFDGRRVLWGSSSILANNYQKFSI